MNEMELVRHRRSVRTFDGRALSQEDADRLMACAQSAENPYGLPIEFRLLSLSRDGLSTPVIIGADTFIAGRMRRVEHAEEAFGYAFETVVLEAERMGLGTTWIAGTMDRAAFERAMDISEGYVMPCVSPVGYPARKMSVRETMMRKGIRADSRDAFSAICFDRSFESPLTPEKAGALRDALEMVRWAPSAVNRQPWRVIVDGKRVHFYEKKSRGFTDAQGWDIQKVDMGIAMCHFVRGVNMTGGKAAFMLADPGLHTPEDTVYIASFETEAGV